MAIGMLMLLAVAVRLWGVDFGLPYAHHVDEPRYLNSAIGILQSGQLDPGFFHQPSLYTYLVTTVMAGYYLVGRLAGLFESPADLFKPPYFFDGEAALPAEFLLSRLLTVAMSMITVWLVFRFARRWIGNAGAIASTAFLTFSIFHVTASHFISTDVPMCLFVVATLFFCVRLSETGDTKDYLLVGLCAGLAIGTKYSAYVVAVPALIAHLVAWRHGRCRLANPALVGLFLATVLTFLATTPYSIVERERFAADLHYEWLHHKEVGHVGAEGASGRWLLARLLTRSDRWLVLAAAGGCVLALRRRHWPTLLVSSFAAAYFASMASNVVRFERFLVPMIPVLAVSAGYLISPALRRRAETTLDRCRVDGSAGVGGTGGWCTQVRPPALPARCAEHRTRLDRDSHSPKIHRRSRALRPEYRQPALPRVQRQSTQPARTELVSGEGACSTWFSPKIAMACCGGIPSATAI